MSEPRYPALANGGIKGLIVLLPVFLLPRPPHRAHISGRCFSAMLRIVIEQLMYVLFLKMDDEWMKRHSAH